MRIAVVGSGISGLMSARLLSRDHDVVLFEAAERLGGHTHTVGVREGERELAVDTGFIVFNDRTYPHFVRLLGELGVAARASTMSFSVRCDRTGLEYNGTSLNALFAQRRNILSPSFLGMVRDIIRFNREAPRVLGTCDDAGLTLGDYLTRHGYGKRFADHYILPMASAIWSAPKQTVMGFPMVFFVQFFHNHGMLSVNDRPVWKTVVGGSSAYVRRIDTELGKSVRLKCPVTGIARRGKTVRVRSPRGEESFDRVVLACHSDQALALLDDPLDAEREVLGAIGYQANEVVLHTDARLLPRRRLAWAAWNYHVPAASESPVSVTYNMTALQGLDTPTQYLVSLNSTERIERSKVLRTMVYHHPIYTAKSVAAQGRRADISGAAGVHYCGAYWGNGFHEDGVVSALAVCEELGVAW